jgi:phosphonoacetaldehyde dehydrogenase
MKIEAMRIAGEKVGAGRERSIEVRYPYNGHVIGSVPKAGPEEVRRAFDIALEYRPKLSRFERAQILQAAARAVRARSDEIAAQITAESGLSMNDSAYETGRVADVLEFGASEVLKDDGQIFSCDITPHGRQRRVYTQREPLLGVITAITPFNHPMNQVAHKVVPSIATNNRMVLKPSEKVPLSALMFADILYEAGLPPPMLSVVTGDPREIADELITNPAVNLVTFTGGVAVGKSIASKAGYRRIVLELGGNDPIIVMDDADLDEASTLAVQGSYKNSGQRCTAVKRMLVHEKVAAAFTDLVVAKTEAWTCAVVRITRRRSDRTGRATARRPPPRRRALRADRHRPRAPRDERRARRDLRPGVADHHLRQHRRGDRHRQRHALRLVVVGVHEPHG